MVTTNTLKLRHIFVLLLVACVLSLCHSETDRWLSGPLTRAPRLPPPPPPRRSPPPPPRSPPPPPPRSSPPPPPRSPPPPPPLSPPPPPRSPPPPPPQSPSPPRSPPPPPPRSPPPPPPRSPPPPPPPPSPPPPPPSPPPPRPLYDYLALIFRWPNAFCKEGKRVCNPIVPKQYFTLHGLWPLRYTGRTKCFCTEEEVTDETLEGFKDDLLKYWPDLEYANDFTKSMPFWKREWRKHGTCSSDKFPPESYFSMALDYAKRYSPLLLCVMENAGIRPDGTTQYSSEQVLDAIKVATGKTGAITCVNDMTGKLQLNEIRICITADGNALEDCTKGNSGCSDKPFIFASPPSEAPAPAPAPGPDLSLPVYTPFIRTLSSMWDMDDECEADAEL